MARHWPPRRQSASSSATSRPSAARPRATRSPSTSRRSTPTAWAPLVDVVLANGNRGARRPADYRAEPVRIDLSARRARRGSSSPTWSMTSNAHRHDPRKLTAALMRLHDETSAVPVAGGCPQRLIDRRDLRPTDQRTWSPAPRAELAAVEPTRACCRAAERAGLGRPRTAGPGRRPSPVSRFACRPTPSTPAFEWASGRDHCRVAYLRGVFLATGSLSLAGGRVHLEFVVPADELRGSSAATWPSSGLPAAWRAAPRTWRGHLEEHRRVIAFLRDGGRAATRRWRLESRARDADAARPPQPRPQRRGCQPRRAPCALAAVRWRRSTRSNGSGRLAALPAPVQSRWRRPGASCPRPRSPSSPNAWDQSRHRPARLRTPCGIGIGIGGPYGP